MRNLRIVMSFFVGLFILTYGIITGLTHENVTAQSDGQDGTFDVVGYNNAPTFISFEGPDTNGATLTPNQTYSVALEIEDIDGLSDLKKLDLIMYYVDPQPTSLSALGSAFDAITTTTIDGTSFIMRWENTATSAAVNSAAGISTGASTDAPDAGFHVVSQSAVSSDISWEIINSTVPAISGTAIPGDRFRFEVEFKISKVAREAVQSQWRFGARIEDARIIENFVAAEQINNGITTVAALQSDFSPVATGTSIQVSDRYNMAFYGEVNVPSGSSLTWLDLSPGVQFSDEEVVSLSGITFIANSDHNRTVKTEAFWTATGAGVDGSGEITTSQPNKNYTGASITSELFDATTEQKFRLGVDTTNAYSSGSLVLLDDTFTFKTIESDQATLEAGQSRTYYFFIELSNLFYDADYIGDVIVGISNRVITN